MRARVGIGHGDDEQLRSDDLHLYRDQRQQRHRHGVVHQRCRYHRDGLGERHLDGIDDADCALSGVTNGPPSQVQFTSQDAGSGLLHIFEPYHKNTTVQHSPFTHGTTAR
ncbi:MAG: hypothetical protein ACR2MN_09640 [Acidimicrobiales bacterium]